MTLCCKGNSLEGFCVFLGIVGGHHGTIKLVDNFFQGFFGLDNLQSRFQVRLQRGHKRSAGGTRWSLHFGVVQFTRWKHMEGTLVSAIHFELARQFTVLSCIDVAKERFFVQLFRRCFKHVAGVLALDTPREGNIKSQSRLSLPRFLHEFLQRFLVEGFDVPGAVAFKIINLDVVHCFPVNLRFLHQLDIIFQSPQTVKIVSVNLFQSAPLSDSRSSAALRCRRNYVFPRGEPERFLHAVDVDT
mmetsp:Transcript_1530/g.2903  ORF Transcript_1530/g.2903 Transcript_1530/m.2903 type:complete len:244 (-) Transcript_1530:140-871(-)